VERKQGQRTGSPRYIYVARADGSSMAPTQVTESSGDEGEHGWQALPKCTKTGTADNDTLTGTSGRYVLCGAAGEDSIDGVGGNHILITGAGDRLAGPAGNDILNGGSGSDTSSYAGSRRSSQPDYRLRQGRRAAGRARQPRATERLERGRHLVGSSTVNVLNGDSGADRLSAKDRRPRDTANGGTGSDSSARDRDTVKIGPLTTTRPAR